MLAIHVGDTAIGICPCPPSMCVMVGVVSSGSPNYLDSGTPRAKIGDMVSFPCGVSVISTGRFNEFINGSPAGILGSSVSGAAQGVVTTGIPMHITV